VVAEDKLSHIAEYATSPLFSEREKVALRYADAITWDPTQADDALWVELKRHFTEPELVELGFLVGVLCGGQRWIHTLDVRHGDVVSESTTGYRPELAHHVDDLGNGQ
jgi:alkylhydroperoxidase family enzyme